MSNIRPDIIDAIALVHSGFFCQHPEGSTHAPCWNANPVTLDYWPTAWGGYAPLVVTKDAWNVQAFGFVLFGTRNKGSLLRMLTGRSQPEDASAVGFCRAGSSRAWFLTSYDPAHTYNARRIFGRYLWRTGK